MPKVFEVWRFLYISLTFGNTFGLLGLYVDINGKISSSYAPTYANLSMEYHEIKLYDLIELNYNLGIRQYFVENWKRFLDDGTPW